MRYLYSLFLLLVGQAASAQSIDTVTIPGTGVTFTLANLPGGTFGVGERGIPITLSPFAISTHEITYDAYRHFATRENDSDQAATAGYSADAVSRPSPPYLDFTYGMGTRGGYPQVNTTQQAALRYCHWLYDKTGRFFRLPTEAEWEYACLADRAPIPEEQLGDYAWLFENGEEVFHNTGLKQPNAWGLYDMLGNVAEWTLDDHVHDYYKRLATQPNDPWMVPSRKHARTVRGGSYDTDTAAAGCRMRERSSPRWQDRDPQIPRSRWWNVDSPFVGFRIVSPAEQPDAAAVSAFFEKAIID